EAHLLDVELHHGIARLENRQGLFGRRDRVLGSLIERLDHAAHGLRVFVGEFFGGNQGGAIHVGAEIRDLITNRSSSVKPSSSAAGMFELVNPPVPSTSPRLSMGPNNCGCTATQLILTF